MKRLWLGMLALLLAHAILAEEAKTPDDKVPEILRPVGEDYVDRVFERLLNEDLQVKSFFFDGSLSLENDGLNLTELNKIIDLKYRVSISDIVDADSRHRFLRQMSFLLTKGKEYPIPRELFDAYVKELGKCEHNLSENYGSGFRQRVYLFVFCGERLDYVMEVKTEKARDFFDYDNSTVGIYAMLHDENGKIMDYRLIGVKIDTDGCSTAAQKICDHLNIGGIIKDGVLASLFLPRDMNDKVLPPDEFMYEYFRLRIESEMERRKYYEGLRKKLKDDIAASKSKLLTYNLEIELKERESRIKEVDELISRLEAKMKKYQEKRQDTEK